jgi:predicted small lipoprotein YifL
LTEEDQMRRTKRHAWRIAVLVAVSAMLALAAGCGQSGPPDSPPSIRGVVTSIDATTDGGSMRVVWTQDPAVGEMAEYDAAQVGVREDTKLWRMTEAGEAESIELAQILVGDVVEAWFSGAVAESYPVQAGADDVVVVGRYNGELPQPQGLEPEPTP